MKKEQEKVLSRIATCFLNEFAVVIRFQVNAELCKYWGAHRLAEEFSKDIVEEQRHAQLFVHRYLQLGGRFGGPDLKDCREMSIRSIISSSTPLLSIKEILDETLSLERNHIQDLKESIVIAAMAEDFTSEDLFSRVLGDEEHHVYFLETQLRLIDQIGIKDYIQIQSNTEEK